MATTAVQTAEVCPHLGPVNYKPWPFIYPDLIICLSVRSHSHAVMMVIFGGCYDETYELPTVRTYPLCVYLCIFHAM